MIQSNELIALIVGLGGLWFLLAYRGELRRLPSPRLLWYAFYFNIATWVCTVGEGLLWEETLNLLEHATSTVTAALLAYWCWKVTGTEKRPAP